MWITETPNETDASLLIPTDRAAKVAYAMQAFLA